MTTPVVALLGTGTMGSAMARAMRRAGLPVRAWNRSRTKAEPLREHGVVVADSPAEAAQGAEIVGTMLFDIAAVGEGARRARPAPGTPWRRTSPGRVRGGLRAAGGAEETAPGLGD